ncbi:MAG: Rrf2 family transcriptional regulator [Halobacteriovoraceae bacterium]|nr:Rrf2 family transcriptional regulator [Halobacteriovoraceae bacterium]MBT5095894.1 Rrf2 family transcriptional regulator [Halobacteriovoraceae bacterium]
MIKMNRKVEYALMSLRYMADKAPSELTSARELVERFNVPFDTVSKVLQVLATKEVLDSHKGIHGGYLLKTDLAGVTFLDLVEWLEDRNFSSICNPSGTPCSLYSTCNIISPVEALNHKILDFLKELTLKELLLDPRFIQSKQSIAAGEQL